MDLHDLSHQHDLILSFFEYLPLHDIGLNCSLTCKDWNLMIKETQTLWRSICINELGWPLHSSTDEVLFRQELKLKIERGEIDALSSPLPSSSSSTTTTSLFDQQGGNNSTTSSIDNKEQQFKSNGKRAISICGKSFTWKDLCYMLNQSASLYFFSNTLASKKDCIELYNEINTTDEMILDHQFPDDKFMVLKDAKLIDCIHTELFILQKQKFLTQIISDKLYDIFIPLLEKLRREPIIEDSIQMLRYL